MPAAVQRINNTTGVITHASLIVIGHDIGLTAGHVNSPAVTLSQIILGTNYNTSTERYNILSSQNYPGYISGNNQTIDLAVVRLSSFVNGFNTPVTFAPFSFGQTLTVMEYGNYGDINTGELQSQGDRLAGRAKAIGASGGYPNGTYYSTVFDGPGASDSLNVGLLPFASGSGWYDTSSGNLAAMSVAATNNSFGGGSSILLNLSDPDVQAWLQPQIQESLNRFNAVPEPSSLLALATIGAGTAYYAARRRRV